MQCVIGTSLSLMTLLDLHVGYCYMTDDNKHITIQKKLNYIASYLIMANQF